MANIAALIRDSIASTVSTTLGATYQELPYQYQLDKIELRAGKKGFGVTIGSASFSDGPTRFYSVDQDFNVQIADRIIERMNEDDLKDSIQELYTQFDAVTKALDIGKAGNPTIVLKVDIASVTEPEILSNDIVLITATYTVKYRQQVL